MMWFSILLILVSVSVLFHLLCVATQLPRVAELPTLGNELLIRLTSLLCLFGLLADSLWDEIQVPGHSLSYTYSTSIRSVVSSCSRDWRLKLMFHAGLNPYFSFNIFSALKGTHFYILLDNSTLWVF